MENDLRIRTKAFALAVVRLYVSLPKTTEAQVLGKQFLRSGTSVGAQYREGTFAKSKPISSARLKVRCKSAKKPVTGLNYLKIQG